MNAMSEKEKDDQRIWALVAHVGAWLMNGLSGGLIGAIVPFAIYLSFRESDAFVADHAKEALNFRITIALLYLLGLVLLFSFIGFCLGLAILLSLWLVELVFTILASIAAMSGQTYRHPICIRLVD